MSSQSPTVTTAAGAVRGAPHPQGAAFFGIPFAEAPVGDLRFAAPRRVTGWEGVRDALRPGPTPQRRPFGPVTTIPEPSFPGDATLNVNVFTPAAGDTAAGLPVLVWIHGGGFFAGSPSAPWYDGRSFARDGVVTVSVSYRLGFDGFGWIDGAPLNRGVLDMIAALEWVQENIRAFGGDPSRVTIAGQSAGGAAVLTLLTSPRTAGLFQAAISESGPMPGVRPDVAERGGRAFAAACGVSPDVAGWRTLGEDEILDRQPEFLNSATAPSPASTTDELIAAIGDADAEMGLLFSPVMDGDAVAADPRGALSSGHGAALPLLLGSTRDEFSFPSPIPEADVVARLRAAGVDEESLSGFLSDVAATGSDRAHSRLVTSQLFRAAVLTVADERRTVAADRTWLYDFAWRSPVTGTAAHCFEIPFAWDLLDADGVDVQFGDHPPQELADRMHADWLSVIREGRAPWRAIGDDPAGAFGYDAHSGYRSDAYAFERALTARV